MGHMIKRDIKKSKDKKTLTNVGDFKGLPMLEIWEVDDENMNVSASPVFSFGKTKAKLIVEHIDAIKRFIKE